MRFFLAVCLMLALAACSGGRFHSPNASGKFASEAIQCVPYAREVSGIQIYGDAHTWWDKASPNYARGESPRPGAVLVLARTRQMPSGHVAVVKRVISDREIDVTHSNWGGDRRSRRMIYDSMRAEDVSAKNDWSKVRFWYYDTQKFGAPYKARGFIYP